MKKKKINKYDEPFMNISKEALSELVNQSTPTKKERIKKEKQPSK